MNRGRGDTTLPPYHASSVPIRVTGPTVVQSSSVIAVTVHGVVMLKAVRECLLTLTVREHLISTVNNSGRGYSDVPVCVCGSGQCYTDLRL